MASGSGGQAISEATLRYFRCSPQKVRLVVDQIRGKNVNQALGVLRLSPKASSRAIEKLLRSAVANAEHAAEKVDADTLFVGEAYVGPGPSLKRFRGRAFGRAFRVLHRTCHITLRLNAPHHAEGRHAAVAPGAGGHEAAEPAAGAGPAAKPARAARKAAGAARPKAAGAAKRTGTSKAKKTGSSGRKKKS